MVRLPKKVCAYFPLYFCVKWNRIENEFLWKHVRRISFGEEGKCSGKKIQMEKGWVNISNDVFTQIAGAVATNCFGVKGMAVRSKTDGLVHLLRRESMAKGVKVTANEDGSVTIDLHIIVDSGVNIAAISSAITNEVTYKVKQYTGVEVNSVEIFIDSVSFS